MNQIVDHIAPESRRNQRLKPFGKTQGFTSQAGIHQARSEMSAFDVGDVWGERLVGLKGLAPNQTRFETNHALVVIVDFDDLQIMPVFARRASMRMMFAEDFQ